MAKGGMHGEGGYAWQGVYMAGACVVGEGGREHAWQGGGGMHGWRDSHCSRRYASYWNAFLLIFYERSIYLTYFDRNLDALILVLKRPRCILKIAL